MYPYFGAQRDAYNTARLGYPKEVMSFIFGVMPKHSKVLDVGCGTGISTRQLATYFDVVGCDIDEKMIEVAQTYDNIKYNCPCAYNRSNFCIVSGIKSF